MNVCPFDSTRPAQRPSAYTLAVLSWLFLAWALAPANAEPPARTSRTIRAVLRDPLPKEAP